MTSSIDRDWLERMYNNRALVPDHARYFERWARDSEAARAASRCVLDMPYGSAPSEALDIFPAEQADAPVLVFIHGGYWRSLDKRDHSFLAPSFTNKGVCVVIPNYALCPGTESKPVTVPSIALQMVQALAWTWRHIAGHGGDPRRITVAGHSAGGHLAAMLLACHWQAVDAALPANLVRTALSISGLYELGPLQHVPSLEAALRLTPDDAVRASPALWPTPARGVLYAVAGGAESDEFHRQNALIRQAWTSRTVPVCELYPGLHHFSVLDALADETHALHARAMTLLSS
ncbi:alpha/beta hydrolase [Variovorax sp. ZT4R33]|uniref:alpha/beta hydrolase n=1 Tax=Variovorax sp. ZT4R33 TaxID=3443743 RepID=UPI003F48559E